MPQTPEKLPLAVVVPAYNEQSTITNLLSGLYKQQQLHGQSIHHYIVDNGSTDATRRSIDVWQQNHEGFPLSVIEEPEKGTGAACDTGFRTAIERGAAIMARTDADCVPAPDWEAKITRNFAARSRLQLLGGRTKAIHDGQYRIGDDTLIECAIWGARAVLSVKHMANYLKVINGGNMAIRANSYEAVEGMPRTSIDTADEDIVFSRRYLERYGMRSVRIDRSVIVATSMRRFRAYGLLGMVGHHLFPSQRQGKDIDIR